MNDCWIGIDLGTSSCKVIAIDGSSRLLGQTSGDYPLQTPRPGWAEQDPELWWAVTGACVRQLVVELPAGTRVRAIGLCGQMHGLTALDAEGQVIRPAILWNDQRSEPHCREILTTVGGLDALLALTGNNMLPGYTAGKILWLRRHEPESFQRMRRFLNPKDFLRLRMTGDYVTDVSDASGTGLFDVRRRTWSLELVAALDLDEGLLPRATESHEVTGRLSAEVARDWALPEQIPVVSGGGDSVLQTTATGMSLPGSLGVTLGTAGIVATTADHCPANDGGRLQVSCGNSPGLWHVMGVALSAGGAFHWLRNALAPLTERPPISTASVGSGRTNVDPTLTFERLVELARSAPAGAMDLLFLPYLVGERCPQVASYARGAWVGLTPAHSAAELVRSVMEGVLLNLRQIRDLFADAGLAVTDVRANGGATREPFWLQMLADVLDNEVAAVSAGEHGGALGAALLAGVGTGHWSCFEEALGEVVTTFTMRPQPDEAAVYHRLFPHFISLYSCLESFYVDLGAEALSPGKSRLADADSGATDA